MRGLATVAGWVAAVACLILFGVILIVAVVLLDPEAP